MRKIFNLKYCYIILCVALLCSSARGQFVLVKDINTGFSPSTPHAVVQFQDHMLFMAYDAVHGGELWYSDGTTNGTSLVKDIYPGSSTSIQEGQYSWTYSLVKVGNRVIFNADDGVHGQELWGSDGTTSGTNMLIDAKPGPTSTYPRNLYSDDSIMIFGVIQAGVYVDDLYVTDGTPTGTHKITFDRLNDQNADVFFKYNHKVYYMSFGSGVLHSIDFANYSVVHEAAVMNSSAIVNFFTFNNKVCYATGYKDITKAKTQYELRSIRDSVNGYDVIYNLGDTVDYVWNAFNDIRQAGNKLIFNVGLGSSASHGYKGAVYCSDGTPQGTHKLPYMNNYFFLCEYNGQIYFQGNYDNNTGNELLATDGTYNGTRIVKDINYGSGSSEIESAIVYQNRIFFLQEGNLWNSDGYSGTFKMSNKLNCQQYNTFDTKLFNFNDQFLLYTGCFIDATGNGDTELWKYDEKNGVNEQDVLAKLPVMQFMPGENKIYVDFKNTQPVSNSTLQLFNMAGQALGAEVIRENASYQPPTGIAPGIYLVTLKNPHFPVQHLKILVTR